MPDPGKLYFSYVRVSTARQGQQGTSLSEQREAIRRYAERHGLTIAREFEERETAAKRGRPVFAQMLAALKGQRAAGVVMHKIDRSARNLKDWADLGELIDRGAEVHFANESLDLHSRGGRLSADIQAVVAADYIRNLREETKKGFYGRVRQGLYPMPARVGYLDRGKGEVKAIDPVQAPLVRDAFELYATGRWGLNALVEEMHARGLRNKRGGRVTRNGLSTMLHNPFYAGLIRLKTVGETFLGRHEPIVSVSLFERVQEVLGGKTVERKQSHEFLFRRHLSCAFCRKTLIPESQKGYTYYRCQSRGCPQKTVREELVEWSFLETLGLLRFNDCELDYLYTSLADSERTAAGRIEERLRSLKLRREQARDRLSRLTDAYMDGVLDREIYVMKKDDLLREEQVVGEKLLKVAEEERVIIKKVEELLERANNAYLTYKEGLFEDRRDLLKTTTSNFVVGHKNVSVKLLSPFRMIAERGRVPAGSPYRAVPRTLPLLLSQLFDYFKNVDLSTAQDSSRPMVVTRNDLPLAA